MAGPWPGAVVILVLTILTVLPVRFIYPNLAPRPWKWPVMAGSVVWAVMLTWMWIDYPSSPSWVMWVSLIYPAFYMALSVWLDLRARQISATAGNSTST
jgi:phosphatidylcholine synthase